MNKTRTIAQIHDLQSVLNDIAEEVLDGREWDDLTPKQQQVFEAVVHVHADLGNLAITIDRTPSEEETS